MIINKKEKSMRKVSWNIFILLFILAGIMAQSSVAAENPPAQESLETRVDKLFAEWDKLDSPGASLAVFKDGSIIYKRGYGSAQLEYNIPITASTIFHVASVSKQFTAFAVALLASQGKLSWDDEVRKHIPEVPDFGKTITLRHLVHHMSGLRDQWEALGIAGWRLDDVITKEHILKMVKHQKELNFNPGEEYVYCNTGFTLLAEVVAPTDLGRRQGDGQLVRRGAGVAGGLGLGDDVGAGGQQEGPLRGNRGAAAVVKMHVNHKPPPSVNANRN
jgi:CubicO group peptidase (beta-lactamase class C family)